MRPTVCTYNSMVAAYLTSICLFLTSFAWANPQKLPSGYTQDVKQEKSEAYIEIYLVTGQNHSWQTNWQKVIFTDELSREFSNRYREKFGEIDTESIVYQENNFQLLEFGRPSTKTEEDNALRREYAEYMMKRLSEFHVDNYFKTQPQMRHVYEAKEKLKNVQVQVTQETKINAQYSLAGNQLDLILENPHLDSKLAIEMDPAAFGPAEILETRLWLGKNINKTTRVNSNFANKDGIAYLELAKMFRWNIGTSFGVSSFFRPAGVSERETRLSMGFSHAY